MHLARNKHSTHHPSQPPSPRRPDTCLTASSRETQERIAATQTGHGQGQPGCMKRRERCDTGSSSAVPIVDLETTNNYTFATNRLQHNSAAGPRKEPRLDTSLPFCDRNSTAHRSNSRSRGGYLKKKFEGQSVQPYRYREQQRPTISTTMPSAAARRLYEDQIPSFMSVYDLDEAMQDRDTVTVVDHKMMEIDPTCNPQLASDPQQTLRSNTISPHHHDCSSTQPSESADSSPTTTVSCTDSSSLSDPSPSSSPDSPVNLVPLNAFPASSFGALPSMANLTVSEAPAPLRLVRPMTSPGPRRPRNMKGLSIQPPFANTLSTSLVSEPASPSFIKPKIPAMRRKPSQLSLKTDTNELAGRKALEVPTSPSLPPILQRRALKHSMSSPHMLTGLQSSTFGPPGGMTFPAVLERNESGLSEFLRPSKPPSSHDIKTAIVEEDSSPIRSQVANRTFFDVEPYHENEANEDQKSPGYPDGPIAIYGDNVFLYLEPTAEEASKFDVVINVAREVKNPFILAAATRNEPHFEDMSPIPDTAVTNASFATAFEFLPEDLTPTTPKAAFTPNEPEYIHMPWDHNTDIKPDLLDLCETIDKKTKEGKKVLIHCQQGASRSASLIIAYGLYQNPELSVNDAYYAAQAKSRWISPNMRLMYCLQDYQKEMSKRKLSPGSGYKPRTGRSPSKHRMTLSVDAIDVPPKEPRTAPLPEEIADSKDNNQSMIPIRARRNSTPNQPTTSPQSASAPSSFSWMKVEDEKDRNDLVNLEHRDNLKPLQLERPAHSGFASSSSTGLFTKPSREFGKPPSLNLLPKPSTSDGFSKPPPSPGFGAHRFGGQGGFGFVPMTFGSISGKSPVDRPAPVPERQIDVAKTFPGDVALMSPRAITMTDNPLHGSSAEFAGMRFVEVPPTPSAQFFSPRLAPVENLFSPRASMFPRDPSVPFGRPPQVADPRSPPTKGETPIIRSIDDLI